MAKHRQPPKGFMLAEWSRLAVGDVVYFREGRDRVIGPCTVKHIERQQVVDVLGNLQRVPEGSLLLRRGPMIAVHIDSRGVPRAAYADVPLSVVVYTEVAIDDGPSAMYSFDPHNFGAAPEVIRNTVGRVGTMFGVWDVVSRLDKDQPDPHVTYIEVKFDSLLHVTAVMTAMIKANMPFRVLPLGDAEWVVLVMTTAIYQELLRSLEDLVKGAQIGSI